MTSCLKCKNPLTLNIDVKTNDYKCSNCSEKYGLSFEKKVLKITHKKNALSFFLNDLSNCDRDFSMKNVYDLYNKGYIDCVKTLNAKYNQSDNFWQLSVAKLREKIFQKLNSKMDSLTNSAKESYSCASCGSKYCQDEALANNFSCIMCSSQLVSSDNSKEIDELKKDMILLEKSWTTSF